MRKGCLGPSCCTTWALNFMSKFKLWRCSFHSFLESSSVLESLYLKTYCIQNLSFIALKTMLQLGSRPFGAKHNILWFLTFYAMFEELIHEIGLRFWNIIFSIISHTKYQPKGFRTCHRTTDFKYLESWVLKTTSDRTWCARACMVSGGVRTRFGIQEWLWEAPRRWRGWRLTAGSPSTGISLRSSSCQEAVRSEP